MDLTGYPATSITTNLCCVTTQKNEDLVSKNAALERMDCTTVKWRVFVHKTEQWTCCCLKYNNANKHISANLYSTLGPSAYANTV
jgi:hypothetical protein